ncbi:MAG: DUF4105 domain-containing protein [Spirochaetia bacterium]|jgi:hypothetical protein|nr:DUF4105 domain-containing protein [Spirochaetia bacterium]
MKPFRFYLLIVLILISITSIYPEEILEDNLEVRLIIIGQGDEIYSLWQHTGIAIKNKINGKDIFFDFGNFRFEDDKFFENFAYGRMLYIAYADYTEAYLETVYKEKRDITEYELNLSPTSKLKMYKDLTTIILPENRDYLYHHYKDNCSTRIRDYIDDAVYGQLKLKTNISRGSSYRKSFLLYTSNNKIAGTFLSILQGPNIDQNITIWQEMFLPDILEEGIEKFKYKNENGEMVSLVKTKNILYKADQREQLPDSYRPPYPAMLISTLILSILILYLNIRSRQNKIRLFALINIIFGFFLGLLGLILVFLATLTNHTYSYNNLNIFMINPIALLLIPASILYWIKGSKWRGKIDLLWYLQLGLTLIMILLKVFTQVKQDNLLEIILFLPIILSFTPLFPDLLERVKIYAAVM